MIRFEEALLEEQIYLINNSAKVRNLEDTVNDFTSFGSDKSPLFFVYQVNPSSEKQGITDMLIKLCKALPYKDEHPFLLEFKSAHLDLSELIAKHSPAFLIWHMPEGFEEQKDISIPIGGTKIIANCKVLGAASLNDIKANKETKRAYWNDIQKLLNI